MTCFKSLCISDCLSSPSVIFVHIWNALAKGIHHRIFTLLQVTPDPLGCKITFASAGPTETKGRGWLHTSVSRKEPNDLCVHVPPHACAKHPAPLHFHVARGLILSRARQPDESQAMSDICQLFDMAPHLVHRAAKYSNRTAQCGWGAAPISQTATSAKLASQRQD